MKKMITAALVAAFFVPLLCQGATVHDGKAPMDTGILRDCIVAGISATGHEPTPQMVDLLLETAAAESKLGWYDVPFKLRGSYGIFQITETTAKDTLAWLERSDTRLWHDLLATSYNPSESLVDNLIFNAEFGAAIAWLVYRRMGGKRLDISTREKRAAAWKRIYNTPLGSGTESGYLKSARECLDADI